jgi:hypothetical protein
MPRMLPVAVLLVVSGCTSGGAALPRTFPAGGTVVFKGGKPMTGGAIELTTVDDPLLRVTATIDEGGKFTLATVKDNARADGAPAGTYRVMVTPPLVSDPRGGVQGAHKGVAAITLPEPLRLDTKDNTNLKIELPTGPPGP